jgi:hypothetical protein
MQLCKKCGTNSVIVAGAGSRNLFIMICKNRQCRAEYVERLSIQTFIASMPRRRTTPQGNTPHSTESLLDL